MSEAVLELKNVSAIRGSGSSARQVLAPVSFSLSPGESLAVIGPSGAGKSTLADIVLGLGSPATGEVKVLGQLWNTATHNFSAQRRHLVQGVPQDAVAAFVPRWSIRTSLRTALTHLAPEREAEQQIIQAARQARFARKLLDRRPHELSGGQAQRAALARALVLQPALLVADEPTSALDSSTASDVTDELFDTAAQSGICLLLITHDPQLASRCTRSITITTDTIH